MNRWTVDKTLDGKRLDAILKDLGAARDVRSARRIIEGGRCKVNGQRQARSSRRCLSGDIIETAGSSNPMLEVLWHEGALAAVSKPRGLECAEGRGSALMAALKGKGLGGYALAHRLDAETTGLLLVASQEALLAAQSLFRVHACTKGYLALVRGLPMDDRGTLEGRILRLGIVKGRPRFALGPRGLEAITDFHVLERAPKTRCSLVAFSPRTGRTHQIRVQSAGWGHPLVGDTLYGTPSSEAWVPGLLLHSWSLAFVDPASGNNVKVMAPLPPEFKAALVSAGLDPDPQVPEFQSS